MINFDSKTPNPTFPITDSDNFTLKHHDLIRPPPPNDRESFLSWLIDYTKENIIIIAIIICIFCVLCYFYYKRKNNSNEEVNDNNLSV